MNDYYNLTPTEQEELAQRLAGGEIVAANTDSRRDTFDIHLSTSTHVVGSYGWDDDNPTEWQLSIETDNRNQ